MSAIEGMTECEEVPEADIEAANASAMVFCGWKRGDLVAFVTIPFFDSQIDASDFAAEKCSEGTVFFHRSEASWVIAMPEEESLGVSAPQSLQQEIGEATGIDPDSTC